MRDGLEIRARVQTKIPKTMKNYAYMAELASNFEGLLPRPLSVTKARPARIGCYTAAAAASSPRCDGPLLSAVTQQRLQPPARGVTARCCRLLHSSGCCLQPEGSTLWTNGAENELVEFPAQPAALWANGAENAKNFGHSSGCSLQPEVSRPAAVGCYIAAAAASSPRCHDPLLSAVT